MLLVSGRRQYQDILGHVEMPKTEEKPMPNMNERVEEVAADLESLYYLPSKDSEWILLAKHVLRRELEARIETHDNFCRMCNPEVGMTCKWIDELQSQLEEIK